MRNTKARLYDKEFIGTMTTEEDKLAISNIDDEREFEKFILQSTPSFIDEEIANTQNEIVSMVRPLFNKLKEKENTITTVMSKAKGFSDYYKQYSNTLGEDQKKINEKREKLRLVSKEIAEYKKKLMKKEANLKEHENSNKDNEALLFDNEEIQRSNYDAFQKYIEEKSQELTDIANEITRQRKENEVKDQELLEKEMAMTLNEEKMNLVEQELKEKYNKLKETNDRIIDQNMNQNTNIEADNSKANIHNNNSNKGNNYNNTITTTTILKGGNSTNNNHVFLKQQIAEKRAELEKLNNQCITISNEITVKVSDLNNRFSIVDDRERNLNLQKEDLYHKLHEVEKKLEETKILTNELKQKEAYIKTFKLQEKSLMKSIDLNNSSY